MLQRLNTRLRAMEADENFALTKIIGKDLIADCRLSGEIGVPISQEDFQGVLAYMLIRDFDYRDEEDLIRNPQVVDAVQELVKVYRRRPAEPINSNYQSVLS